MSPTLSNPAHSAHHLTPIRTDANEPKPKTGGSNNRHDSFKCKPKENEPYKSLNKVPFICFLSIVNNSRLLIQCKVIG